MENNELHTALPVNRTVERQNCMLAALGKHFGIVQRAAKAAGIEAEEHYHWLKADEQYKKAVHKAFEQVTDTVEGKLFDLIEKGNITAVIFYLKTRGKNRGYAQREKESFSKWPYTVDVTTETEEELKWRNSI